MLTTVSINMLNYLRKHWFDSEVIEEDVTYGSDRQVDEFTELFIDTAMPYLTGLEQGAKQVRSKGIDWWETYHPDSFRNSGQKMIGSDYETTPVVESDEENESDEELEIHTQFRQKLWQGSLIKHGACNLCRFNIDLWNKWA